MRALILEDEPAATANLEDLLAASKATVEVVAALESVSAAIEWLSTQSPPEVIFSDIELADGSAFEVFEAVDPPCPVVFITAYDAYALQAFRHNGLDYLLKPLQPEELDRALTKLQRRGARPGALPTVAEIKAALLPTNYRRSFLLPFRDRLLPVSAADIAYFYTERDVVFARLATDDRRYVVDHSLEQLEEQLDPGEFIRANRQTIVRRSAIAALQRQSHGRYLLRLDPDIGWPVPISKARAPHLKQWLSA